MVKIVLAEISRAKVGLKLKEKSLSIEYSTT